MISSSSAASRARGRRVLRGAALALSLSLSLVAAPAAADGGEDFEPAPEVVPAERVIESLWRRPEGCEPAPILAIREDGARVLSAQPAPPACRLQGDADAQVRAWLDSMSIEVDGRVRRRPPRHPRR